MRCTRQFESRAWKQGYRRVAGVDEVGRGALFGPVVAAAVILDPARTIRGIDRKSTRLNSSHIQKSRMPSSA